MKGDIDNLVNPRVNPLLGAIFNVLQNLIDVCCKVGDVNSVQ